jgi:hypothetical protein
MGGGLAVRRDGAWTSSSSGLAAHGGSAIHVTSFADLGGGRSLATLMKGGLAESLDGGASWSQLTPAFTAGPVWAALPLGSRVLLATDTGLMLYAWPPAAPAPAPWWWVLVLVGSLGLVLAAVRLAMLEPAPAAAARPQAA